MPVKNSELFAAMILKLANSPDEIANLGRENFLRTKQKFSIDQMLEHTVALIHYYLDLRK